MMAIEIMVLLLALMCITPFRRICWKRQKSRFTITTFFTIVLVKWVSMHAEQHATFFVPLKNSVLHRIWPIFFSVIFLRAYFSDCFPFKKTSPSRKRLPKHRQSIMLVHAEGMHNTAFSKFSSFNHDHNFFSHFFVYNMFDMWQEECQTKPKKCSRVNDWNVLKFHCVMSGCWLLNQCNWTAPHSFDILWPIMSNICLGV